MTPLSTTIEGFGPHLSTEVDWSNLGPVSAVVGPNGSGKSFLLEADFACLYGSFPSQPGSLYDAMSQHALSDQGEGDARLETQFAYKGKTYRAERVLRTTAKTQRQEASLYLVDTDEELLAGPKVRDFEDYVTTLMGPKEAALASWFASQGGAGDLVGATPADRRAILGEMLGLGDLDNLSAKAREAAKEARTTAQVLESQLEDTPDFADLRETTYQSIQELQDESSGLAAEIESAERELETLSAKQSALQSQRQNAETRLVRARELTDRREALQERIERLQADMEDLEDAPGLEQAKKDLQRYRELGQQLDDYEKKQEVYLAYQEEASTYRHFQRRLEEEERKLTGHPTNLDDLQAELAEAQEAYRDAVRLESQLTAQIESAEHHLSELVEVTLDDTPADNEVCQSCTLYTQAANPRARYEKERREALAALEEAPSEDEARERVVDAEIQLENAKEEHKQKQIVQRLKQRLEDADPGEEPEDHSGMIKALRTKREPFAGASDRLAHAHEANRRLGRVREDLTETQEELRTLDKPESTEKILKEIRDIDKQITGYNTRTDTLRSKLKALGRQMQKARSHIARYEEKLQQIDSEEEKTTKKRKRARQLRDRSKRMEQLKEIFGPRGVQTLLIDAASVEVEKDANSLLEEAFDGRFQLSIRTQTENQDGTMREDFAILGRDWRGERPIERFSGGEQRLFQIALRLALVSWLARTGARASRTVRIDEGFDALDSQRAQAAADLFATLGKRFDRVLVVTHSPALASELPARLELTPKSDSPELKIT